MNETNIWSSLEFVVTRKMNTNMNVNVKPAINNCASEWAIVWEPLARIIGTQHVLIYLMNDAHEVRQWKPASAFKMIVNSTSFLRDVQGLIAPIYFSILVLQPAVHYVKGQLAEPSNCSHTITQHIVFKYACLLSVNSFQTVWGS
jgi:hypothetical protein